MFCVYVRVFWCLCVYVSVCVCVFLCMCIFYLATKVCMLVVGYRRWVGHHRVVDDKGVVGQQNSYMTGASCSD